MLRRFAWLTLFAAACAHAPAPRQSEILPVRSRALKVVEERLGTRQQSLRQIPSFVVDKGTLAFVPYSSYRVSSFEVNIYGDPDDPACAEVGTYDRSDEARAAVLQTMKTLLRDGERLPLLNACATWPSAACSALAQAQVVTVPGGLTVEVTPADAPDAYGAWWVSAYDVAMVEASRVRPAEMSEVADVVVSSQEPTPPMLPVAQPAPEWSQADYAQSSKYRASPGGRVYVKGYYRKNGTYVRGHTRRR